MHGHGKKMFRAISLGSLQARSKALSHRHGRVFLPDRSDAGHGQMLKRQEKMKRRLGVCRCGLPQQLLKAHAMLGYVAVDCPANQTRRCGLEKAGDY